MNWLKNIFREIFGLFVDDGSFALLAILIWLSPSCDGRWPRLNIPSSMTGVIPLRRPRPHPSAESANPFISRRKQ